MNLDDLFTGTDEELRALLDDPARAAEWMEMLHQRIMEGLEQQPESVPPPDLVYTPVKTA